MKKETKNIVAVLGVISTVVGVIGAVPSFLGENYALGLGFSVVVVIGLVLLAISFGD